jgi:putative NADH-flavin reductase
MKILVFGASGQTGREIVRQAVARKHEVTAFVRNPSRLQDLAARVQVFQGDITDPAAVTRAIEGHAAVLSALGAPNPIQHYQPFQTGIENILHGMEALDVRRLVYLSFVGVNAGTEDLRFFLNQVASRLLRAAIADHRANERAIRASRLSWTIVHAAKLTNGRMTGAYRSGESVPIRSAVPLVSRADVADFMLQQLTDVRYISRSPRVMN